MSTTLAEPPTTSHSPSLSVATFDDSQAGSQHTVIETRDFCFFYGEHQTLHNISMAIDSRQVLALIGPSGCGKSTFLKSLNRMNDLVPGVRMSGTVEIEGENIYDHRCNLVALRRKVGMVFQKYNPFPQSIFDNVAYGIKLHKLAKSKAQLREMVEMSLMRAGLWDEVKDRLHTSALSLSGGQQQRLCIARALAIQPEVILMDEPTSALDPAGTAKVEQLIQSLRQDYTLIVVTHNMQQAKRISDRTAFFYEGHLVEVGETQRLFSHPQEVKTQEYISGTFS